MKKHILVYALALVAALFAPTESTAQQPTSTRTENLENPQCSQEVEDLYARLDAIDEMDKSDLPRSEKKALREEVKTIQQRLEELGNGVYISAGALILILILLIILI
ncbi:MAG: hypothetical protein ACKVOK_12035 [Flavobacteriales bacterium]